AGRLHVAGDDGHVDAGLPGSGRLDAVLPDSLVARPRARHGRAPHAHAVLVHRTPDRLLLAAAGLHLLVHAHAAPGRWTALQRPDGARLVPAVPDPVVAAGSASPGDRPGHPRGLEALPGVPHLRGLLPELADLLQRGGFTRECRPCSGRE